MTPQEQLRAPGPQTVTLTLACLRPELVRLAHRFANTDADAEDLVHEAYARALDSQQRVRADSDLRGWMKRIMRNLAIDHARKNTVRRRVIDPEFLPAPIDPDNEPSESISLEDLRDALNALPLSLRRSAELRFFHRRSYSAIAAELGIPVKTVGTRLMRARMRLRSVFESRQSDCAGPVPAQAA